MRPLLRQYLILAVLAQFGVALFVDLGGLLFAGCYHGLDMKLPNFALFMISIRHWAFAWPLIVAPVTAAFYHRARTDGVLLHLFAGLMLAAIAVLFIAYSGFVLPMFSLDTAPVN